MCVCVHEHVHDIIVYFNDPYIEKLSKFLKVDDFLHDFSEDLAGNTITFNAFKLKIYSRD